MCLSVRGALNWTNAEMKRMAPCITVNNKPLKTAADVKCFLLNELSKGHEVLPTGDCDNFDWKTGCKGHVNLNQEIKVHKPCWEKKQEPSQPHALPTAKYSHRSKPST
jgi:hypothetical protein